MWMAASLDGVLARSGLDRNPFSGSNVWALADRWWIRRWIGGWPGMNMHLRPLFVATGIFKLSKRPKFTELSGSIWIV